MQQLSVHWKYNLRGCGMAQLHGLAGRAAVRRPRVRISARHPSGGPLPKLVAKKKLERNSANVIMNMYECTVYNEETQKRVSSCHQTLNGLSHEIDFKNVDEK